jgi:hypothetical protein
MHSPEFEAHKKVVSILNNQSAFSISEMSPPSSVTRIGETKLLLVKMAKLFFVIFLGVVMFGNGLDLTD